MSRKIYFVCAPVFLYWPVAISKELNKLVADGIVSGGFIGGPKKYHELLTNEWGVLANHVIYTHDLEEHWLNNPYSQERLNHFIDLFGNQALNELVISDRQIGCGFLSGGGIAKAKIVEKIKNDKDAHLNYIVGMLNYLEDFFIKNKPDAMYSYAVAGAFTLAISMFANKYHFAFIKLSHSRIGDRVVLDTSPTDSMEVVEKRYFDKKSYSQEAITFAQKYLSDFREKQSQPDYQVFQNKVYKDKTELKNQLKLIVKAIKGKFDSSNDYFQGSYSGNVTFEQNVVSGIKKYWKQKPFFEKEVLINKPFFFFTLHVDPEASTMVISPYQTNQYAVIEAIAKSKPIDHIIIVKEHLTMIGRRPKGFYEKINALPGVYMVNPLESSFQFINAAKAVLTITGTSGLEAIMLKKPTVFLGKFIYSWIEEGFVCTNDLSSLSAVLLNVNQIRQASDETLKRLLMAVYETSFSFNGNLIWGGINKEVVKENPAAVISFAQEISKFLK